MAAVRDAMLRIPVPALGPVADEMPTVSRANRDEPSFDPSATFELLQSCRWQSQKRTSHRSAAALPEARMVIQLADSPDKVRHVSFEIEESALANRR
jgi:hypothetical protein